MRKSFEIFEIQALPAGFVFVLVLVVVVSKIFIKTSSPEGTALLCGIPDCLGGCGKGYVWVFKDTRASGRMQPLLPASLCKLKPVRSLEEETDWPPTVLSSAPKCSQRRTAPLAPCRPFPALSQSDPNTGLR